MNFIQPSQNLGQLCTQNIGCLNKGCDLKHPRVLAGVCINYLRKICNDKEQCQLQHLSIQQLKQEFNSTAVNGVYIFNICQTDSCQNQQCRFVHVPWFNLICWKCVDVASEECEQHSQEMHNVQWLRKAVYEKYDVQDQNPESLCLCEKQTCNKKSHHLQINEYCLYYFQGLCPLILCNKQHVKWEDFKTQTLQQNNKDQVIKPCIMQDQRKQFIKQQQTYSVHIFQPKILQEELLQAIVEEKVIDIIFILDCTSSMLKWIEVAKNSIGKIMQEFTKIIQHKSIIRIAAVCYRDLDCEENNIVSHNFTTHTNLIQEFIGKQKVVGGEDIPEDLIGALNEAYELNISANEESLLNIFVMTDAPCHGRQYHDLMWDEYSDRYEGKLEEILQKFRDLKKRLFFTFFHALNQQSNSNKLTEKMEKIMESQLKDQFFTACIGENQFADYVKFSLQTSLNQKPRQVAQETITRNVICEKQQFKNFVYDKTNRSQSFLDIFQQQLHQSVIKTETTLKIQVKEEKISEQEKGANSSIFKAFDTKKNSWIVLKIPKYISQGSQSAEDIQKAEQEAQTRYREQLIAQQLMTLFNEKTLPNLRQMIDPYFYSQPCLYRFKEPFFGMKIIYGETFINIENAKWTKHSNNSSWASGSLILAFSHFTFEITNYELIITDLQGKLNLLSDPAVHTLKPNIFLQSSNNFEEIGIQEFFKYQHPLCNDVCKNLQLKQLEENLDEQNISLELQEGQISQQLIQTMIKTKYFDEKKFIFLICSNCGKQDDLREESDHLCRRCEQQLVGKNQQAVVCECCRSQYLQNYKYEELEATVKYLCPACKIQLCNIQSNPKCHYCNESVCNQFKNQYQIEQQSIYLCIDAVNYLKSLQCQKCRQWYCFKKILSNEEFSAGKLQCC